MSYGIYSQAVDAAIDEYDTPLYCVFTFLFVWYEACYLARALLGLVAPSGLASGMLEMQMCRTDPFFRKELGY